MLEVIKGGMKANETSSYSLYRTSLEKTDQKDKDIKERKERKERCMPKARREGTLVFSADRFPAKGVTLPTSTFSTTSMYLQHT